MRSTLPIHFFKSNQINLIEKSPYRTSHTRLRQYMNQQLSLKSSVSQKLSLKSREELKSIIDR